MEEIKKQEITSLLDTIKRQVEQITDNQSGFSMIEKDILKENLRKFYVLIEDIDYSFAEISEDEDSFKEVPEEKDSFTETSKLFFTDEPVEVKEKPQKPIEKEKVKSNSKDSKSIHELATEKTAEKTIGENIRSNSIDSLKKHIGINDKFQFINELFDGKMKAYNEAVESLDQMKDKKAAHEFIKPIQENFSWDVESPVYEQFMGYLTRRFS